MSERKHGKTELMTHDEMESLLKKCVFGRMGLTYQNESYIVPMSYGFYQGRLFFHCGKHGKKIDFIKNNNRVCFEVSELGEGWYSVICYGTATIKDDIETKREWFEVFLGQTPSDEQLGKMETYIGVIEIEEMTGKCRPGPANPPVTRLRKED